MVALVAMLSATASAAPRVALVIGNAAYAHAPALANPLNDAADMGAALDRLGFSVTRLENADQAGLRRGLQEFALAASASEVAVVFYAGHGIEVDQRNFLVPVDARLASDQDVEFEAVPLELVSRAVERASGLRLVILDACRENPFAVKMQRTGATRSIGRGLARVEPSGETLVAYAAKEGTFAADGAGRNSPYTEALLEHLEEPRLDVGLMFRRVRDTVLRSTGGQQEPFLYGSLSSREVYLAAGPAQEPGPPERASTAGDSGSPWVVAERELLFWESVKDSEHPADIELYLDRYPSGIYEALARSRLKRLEEESEAPEPAAPSVSARVEAERLAAEREFWASVKASEDPADFRAYLEQFPGGMFEMLARNRLVRFEDTASAKEAAASSAPAPAGPTPAKEAAASSAPAPAGPTPDEVEAALGLERTKRRMVQQGLASLGHAPGAADGLFGSRTREAIRRYQGTKGFETTGYLTAEQSRALVALGEEATRARAKAEAERRKAERRAEATRKERERQRAEATRKERERQRAEATRKERERQRAEAARKERQNGFQTVNYIDGARYVGWLRYDQRHGRGTMTWPDGKSYVGQWHNDKPHGHGVYNFDGNRFEGQWRDGCFEQDGFFTVKWAAINTTKTACGFDDYE